MRYVFLIFVFLFAYKAPYSDKKFKDILHKAKLQAPLSYYNPKYSTKYGQFKGVKNRYFYLENGAMVFKICNKGYRSELRFKDEWIVNTKKTKTLYALIKIIPMSEKKELTFIQIHTDFKRSLINKPILRLVWYKKLKHTKNHIWAVIKKKRGYLKIDLGKLPKNFFEIKIKLKKSDLEIFVNKLKKADINISDWKNIFCYFKIGLYLQGQGCAEVLVKKLYVN